MGVDVVAGDQIGTLAGLGEFPSEPLAEELPTDGDPECLGGSRSPGGRLDAEAGDAGGNEVLQQIAVVRRNFDHETALVETKPLDDHGCITGGMLEPRGGSARKIGVVGSEQVCRRRVVLRLDEPAPVTDHHPQGKKHLRPVEILGRQVGIRGRCDTQIEKGVHQRSIAVTAVHHGIALSRL